MKSEHPELPFNRARGRTTRLLWKALVKASEQSEFAPLSFVVVVVENLKLARWTYDYMCRLVAPVADGSCPRGPFRFDRARMRVTFPNGASVEVVDAETWDRRRPGFGSAVFVLEDRT